MYRYSCDKNYHIEKSYNGKKRFSKIYLYEGTRKVDSISLFDYYDKAQIKKYKNNKWLIYYCKLPIFSTLQK
ncbi:hypothetical protein ACM44_13965 [Chryseobacterium koreense CCUG 49689]|uniref:Uncharacterized protein n=1 Tax=Chryseobacterium koreense CCUG 49689 TaxID=1304281 RepID=A0A0J7IWE8_9FLAO|nr:hypothetical protein ACM44_13965 [Chryseobacterium koreense CCUG 49689]